MVAQDTFTLEELATVHSDDPKQMREEVVEKLYDAIPCEVALFFKCVEDSQGNYYFSSPVGTGNPDLLETIFYYCRRAAVQTPWLPPNVDPNVVNNFIRTRTYYDDDFIESFEVERKVMKPLGIYDQMRTLLYDGSRLLGWCGLMRKGRDEVFQDAEEQLARSVHSAIKTTISTAESMECDILQDELFAVLKSNGEVEHCSRQFARWSNKERASYLRRRVRDADGGAARLGVEIYAAAEVRLARLDATNGVRYLATVESAQPMCLTARCKLTERQREIAEYAAAGATSREIGDTLGLSHHTVRTHLKNIYERLDVSTRVELAAEFNGE